VTTFDDVLGQSIAVSLLRRALAAGRLPHALLFQGPAAVGKATVARVLAGALLCDAPGPAGPCGRCGSCRKLAHGNHPDSFTITRLPKRKTAAVAANDEDEADEDGPDAAAGKGTLRPFIVVDQIRDLLEHVAFPPREGRARVILIDPADRMHAAAQNALLKTLEEPASRTVFVLVASRPHLLLPTVRSRCLTVRFAALPVPELARLLVARGQSDAEALERAGLAGGRPGAALSLEPGSLRRRRDAVLAALETCARGVQGLADVPAVVAALLGDDEDGFLEGLEILEALLRDAALVAAGAAVERLVHADARERTAALGGRLGAPRAAAIVRSVERLRHDLRLNVNRTLVAEALLAAVAGGPVP
jgi:DNA polymerase-3 subunit delta'